MDDEGLDEGFYIMDGMDEPYEELFQSNPSTFVYLFEACVIPTTTQSVQMIAPLAALCFLLRCVSVLHMPPKLIHFFSLSAGVAALVHFSEFNVIYCLALSLLGHLVLVVSKPGYRGFTLSVVALIFLLLCELLIVGTQEWHRIRGSQMVLAIKIISLGYDLDQAVLTATPTTLEYYGYSLSVSSVIFGPFITYQDYTQILSAKKMSLAWIIGILRSLAVCYICLIVSVCVFPMLFPEDSYKWLIAYQTAASFRYSHYFVCFLSESMLLLSGIGKLENNNQDTIWRVEVARPQHVEIPRSLVEVVIHWNIPHHVFLKNYVYKRARPLGVFVAILCTYIASSLLHGINFPLASVLLSIGLYAYIENILRKRLSDVFSACIQARRCKAECQHVYKSDNFWVTAINLAFGFVSVFHLAYLGIMFDGDPTVKEQGYGVQHTITLWSNLDFASHWVALGSYIFYKII